MTIKQKKFVKAYQETGNGTQAVIDAGYKVKARSVAGEIAKENLKKPYIRQALEANSDLFESTIVKVVNDWGDSDNTRRREIALNNAQWAHDKIHGKATQKIETKNTSVEVKLDLSGTRVGVHYVQADTDTNPDAK